MLRIRFILCACLSATTLLHAQPAQHAGAARKLSPNRQFVLDAVKAAVALPQPDPQDRLRVLAAAAQLVGPVSRSLERRYAREGARLEAELIASGREPATSVLSSGHVECASAAQFLDGVPNDALPRAEQSLISIVSVCPRLLESARRKVAAALDAGVVAPRAVLAVSEKSGLHSRWAQAQFEKLFSTLPSSATQHPAEFAHVYAAFAPSVGVDLVSGSGLRLLSWLARMDASGERNVAVTVVSGAMRDALGAERYAEALRQDATASLLAASTDGQHQLTPENQAPEQDSVPVLTMMNEQSDQANSLAALGPVARARRAAALGFGAASRGDRRAADRYLDLAFLSAQDVWAHRAEQGSATAVLQEISEAAAQVDSLAAMKRAQQLEDPTAESISILAIARVVLGQGQR